MAPLYETLVSESVLEMDQSVLDAMRAKIQDEVKKLDEKWVRVLSFIDFWENIEMDAFDYSPRFLCIALLKFIIS